MNAARRDGGEGGGPRRFYKLVGALVVALVIAAALVPLWLGGGSGQQPRVVEVEPDVLRDGGTERSRQQQAEPATEPSGPSREPAPDQNGGSGDNWWQADDQPDADDGGATSRTDRSAESSGKASGAPAPQTSSSERDPDTQSRPEADTTASGSGQGTGGDGDGGEPQTSAEPAEATASAESGTEPEGPYWTVMVGSFRDPDNAAGLRERLREQGFAAQVVTKMVEGEQWNRVYAGREQARQGAESLLPRLKEAGYKDMLVLQAE